MKIRSMLLVIFLMVLSFKVYAQQYAVDKKATWLSLTGSFTSSGGTLFEDSYHKKTTTMSLSPSISHFVTPNFFIGGGISSSHQTGGSEIHSLNIGPFIGYAFGNSENSAFPYIDLGLSYCSLSSNTGYNSNNYGAAGLDVFSDFGVIFPIKSHIGLMCEVGYHAMRLKMINTSSSKSGNILTFSMGFVGLIF